MTDGTAGDQFLRLDYLAPVLAIFGTHQHFVWCKCLSPQDVTKQHSEQYLVARRTHPAETAAAACVALANNGERAVTSAAHLVGLQNPFGASHAIGNGLLENYVDVQLRHRTVRHRGHA